MLSNVGDMLYFIFTFIFYFTACMMPPKRQYSKSTSSTPEKPPQKVKRVVGCRKEAKSRKVLFLEPSAQNESDDVSVSMCIEIP